MLLQTQFILVSSVSWSPFSIVYGIEIYNLTRIISTYMEFLRYLYTYHHDEHLFYLQSFEV